jgi:hypothetical protein
VTSARQAASADAFALPKLLLNEGRPPFAQPFGLSTRRDPRRAVRLTVHEMVIPTEQSPKPRRFRTCLSIDAWTAYPLLHLLRLLGHGSRTELLILVGLLFGLLLELAFLVRGGHDAVQVVP